MSGHGSGSLDAQVRQPEAPRPDGLFRRLKSMGRRTAAGGAGAQDAGPASRPDVQDVLAALSGCGAMIVYTGAGDGDPPVLLAGGVDEEEERCSLTVPEGTEVAVVLVDVHFPHAAVHLLHDFRAQSTAASTPIIALLLHAPGRPKDLQPLVGATSVLATAPADDIIVQPAVREDLPAMLAVTAEKVNRRAKALRLEAMAAQVTQSGSQSRTGTASGLLADPCRPSPASPSSGPSSAELEPSAEQKAKERGEDRRLCEMGLPDSPSSSSSSSSSVPAKPCSPRPADDRIEARTASFAFPSRRVQSEAKRVQSKHSSSQARMWDECRLLRRLRHPNVVSVQELVDAQLSRPLKGVSSRHLRHAILDAGGFMLSAEAQVVFYQICAGLAYIHECRIGHRNLKPESVLVSDGHQVKLANFTLAVRLGSSCKAKCGTMPFVAPEVLAGRAYDASAADVWSVGVVLLEMLCGINKLPRMLGWSGTSSPSAEHARQLEDYFHTPDRLLLSCEADLGPLKDGLDLLMSGMLTVALESRWTAARARDGEWTRVARDAASLKATQSEPTKDNSVHMDEQTGEIEEEDSDSERVYSSRFSSNYSSADYTRSEAFE